VSQIQWSELPFFHPVPKTPGVVSVSLWNLLLSWPALLSHRNFTDWATQPVAASGRYASSQTPRCGCADCSSASSRPIHRLLVRAGAGEGHRAVGKKTGGRGARFHL